LLVTWVPETSPEARRAECVRNRALLSGAVPQPFFLREHFAAKRAELTWAAAGNSENHTAAAAPVAQRVSSVAVGQTVQGPITCSSSAEDLLKTFAQQKDTVVRLQLAAGKASQAGGAILEGKVHDCRSVAHLAKSALPSSPCFLVCAAKGDIVFVLWCPSSGSTRESKDAPRLVEETRHAVMKGAALSAVLGVLPEKPKLVVQFDAREAQDIHDGLLRTLEASPAPPWPARGPDGAERGWPAPGAPGDWPCDWPSSALEAARPSTMVLFERPVPPWRGGSKAHSVSSEAPAARRRETRPRSTRLY